MSNPNEEAVKRGIVVGCKVIAGENGQTWGGLPFTVEGFDDDGDPIGTDANGAEDYEFSRFLTVVGAATPGAALESASQRCIAELDDAAETCAQEGGNPAEFWALIAEHAKVKVTT